MGKSTLWKDEYTLLCERCGYVVQGLDSSGGCPECGKPIRESLPSARTGTPIQAATSCFAQALAIPRFVASPRRWYALARIDEKEARSLLVIMTMLATALGLVLFFARAIPELLAIRRRTSPGSSIVPIFVFTIMVALSSLGAVRVLTLLEAAGLRFFGGKRGWRITRAVSYTVVAHAAPAWALAVAGFWFGLRNPTLVAPLTELVLRTGVPILLPPDVVLAGFFGFLPGMLLFESIVYIGVRQNRYANTAAAPDTRDRNASSLA